MSARDARQPAVEPANAPACNHGRLLTEQCDRCARSVLPPPIDPVPGLAQLHRAITENTAAVRELTAQIAARREVTEVTATAGDETLRLEVRS